MRFRSRYAVLHGREVHYTEWGHPAAEAVVMWHGLVRTGRDFDEAASALAGRWRIICPDTIGRGLSQWSADPGKEYTLAFYAAQAEALLDQLGIGAVRWVGTSMGGALGMSLAAGPLSGRIRKLVLNDIGPAMPAAAAARIGAYVANPPRFATVAEAEGYFRAIYKPYGIVDDEQWRRLTETSLRRRDDGGLAPHYDPRIGDAFLGNPQDFDLWPAYDAIASPTLLLRGADSDVLTAATAEEMTRRGPRCRLLSIPGRGHAPALDTAEQIRVLSEFLEA